MHTAILPTGSDLVFSILIFVNFVLVALSILRLVKLSFIDEIKRVFWLLLIIFVPVIGSTIFFSSNKTKN
jgi:hypothetical protein